MSVLCGWASIDERGKVSGGKAGDQTGKEVKTGPWYDFGQTTVLRWKDEAKAKKYTKAIKALCKNKHNGYDQLERTSLYSALKKLGWDYTKLTKDVECDCSELVVCAVNCVLGKAAISSAVYTGNLNNALMNSGYFKKLTGSKYCNSSNYLAIGDVINAPGHHVISCLENGPKAGKKSDTSKVAEPTLKKGSTGSEVKKLQSNLNKVLGGDDIETDGIFGIDTRDSVKRFQKKYGLSVDGIYGSKSAAKMKTLIK